MTVAKLFSLHIRISLQQIVLSFFKICFMESHLVWPATISFPPNSFYPKSRPALRRVSALCSSRRHVTNGYFQLWHHRLLDNAQIGLPSSYIWKLIGVSLFGDQSTSPPVRRNILLLNGNTPLECLPIIIVIQGAVVPVNVDAWFNNSLNDVDEIRMCRWIYCWFLWVRGERKINFHQLKQLRSSVPLA